MKKLLYLLLLLVLPAISYSQQYFPKAVLAADLDTIYLHLREIHPDMLTFISKKDFEKEFDNTKTSLPDSLTRLGFYRYAAHVMALVKDCHTHIKYPLDEFYRLNPWIFPANVRIDDKDSTLIVRASRYPELVNSTILSINGRSAESIARELLSYAPAETPGLRANNISNSFQYLFYFIDSSEVYDIEYMVDGQVCRQSFNADKVNRQPQAGGNSNDGKKNDPSKNFSFSKLNPQTVLFTMRRFDITNGYYQSFTDSLFAFIKEEKIENLIIDIRDNPGGDDAAIPLLNYICPVNYHLTSRVEFYRTPLVKRYGIEGDDHGHLKIRIKKLKPFCFSKRFKGNVFVLTNRGSASASGPFAHTIKYYKLGKIVGEKTGGCPSSFGDSRPFTLPHTNMRFNVAFKEFFPAGGKRLFESIIPDYEVPSEQALDKALEIIEAKKKK